MNPTADHTPTHIPNQEPATRTEHNRLNDEHAHTPDTAFISDSTIRPAHRHQPQIIQGTGSKADANPVTDIKPNPIQGHTFMPIHPSLISSYVNWLEQQDYHIKVTLNFKPNTKPHQAVIHARKFWNMIDRAVYGANAVKRHHRRLNRVCVLEGVQSAHQNTQPTPKAVTPAINTPSVTTPAVTHLPARSASFALANPHYHCAVKAPDHFTHKQLADLILDTWNGMRCAGRFSEVQIIHQPNRTRWLSYILKHAGQDSICLQTSTIRDPHAPLLTKPDDHNK